MSLTALINTVKTRLNPINEDTILRIFDIISNEDNFTVELLVSTDINEQLSLSFLEILEQEGCIKVNYKYECNNEGGDTEIASSFSQLCEYCKMPINNSSTHILQNLYSLNFDNLNKELEEYRVKILEKFVDKAYIPNVKRLKKDLQNIVPFLGSGISIPLGLPNWTGLIEGLKPGLAEQYDIEQFEKYLSGGDIFNALELLKSESIAYSEEEQIKTFIQEFIKSKFRRELDMKFHNINDILNLNSDFYITTNYDNALSVYKGKYTTAPFVLDDLKNMQDLFKEKEKRIIHLHGNVERKETMVVTKKDYENIYINSEKNKSILNGIMAPKSFLFMGFSFNDKYFSDLYNLLRSYISGSHFIILSDLHEHAARDLNRIGLQPISIKVNRLEVDESMEIENEYNSEYTQKFVYSLKQLIKYLLS